MRARYLTFFSYIGTNFRSSEKIWLKEGQNYPDPESIQGMMEMGLLKLKSLNYPKIVLSSRTDGGVHALKSSAHFDLERFGTNIYDPDNVAYQLNKFFYKHNTSIFISKCVRVPDNFNARYKAVSRSYLYRLAVLKAGFELPEKKIIASFTPIEEWKRCHFARLSDFNIDKLKEGTKYFEGYHDFTTFKKFDKMKQHKHNRRELYSIEVKPGRPLVTSYTESDSNGMFDYWDITFHGRGFVHNQIRRIMGTLLSVATGKLPVEEIKVMLQVPSKHSWYSFIQNCPPDGLYLCNVEYNPEDLIYNPNDEAKDLEETKKESDSEN